MKKRALTLVVLLIAVHALSYGQTIVKSFPEKFSNKYVDYEILGKNNIGTLVHHFGPDEHAIAVYNDNLRLVTKQVINVKEKKAVIERLVPVGNEILVFYSLIDNKFIYLKAKKISSNFQITVEPVIIDSIPRSSWDGPQPYYIKPSNDYSKILVFHILSSRSQVMEIRASILDAALNKLTDVVMTAEGKEDMALKSIRVSNQGNILAVVSHLSKRTEVDEYFITDRYTVFNYSFASNKQIFFTIGEEDYLFKDVITGVDNETGRFFVAGCYQHRKNREDLGLFVQKSDLSGGEFQRVKKIPFTETDIALSQSFSFRNWYEKAEIIRPQQIIPRSDGGFILITESEYQYTRVVRTQPITYSMYGEQTLRYYDQNHYYGITAYSLSPETELDWKRDLPKAQVSEGDGGLYSSFALFQANNVLKFLFNENITQSGNFLEYNINPKGEMKRSSLFNAEKEEMLLIPQKARQLPGNMLLVPGENRKAIQFVLIKY